MGSLIDVAKEFAKTDIFKKYVLRYDTICVFLDGSILNGTVDERSDIDIHVVIADNQKYQIEDPYAVYTDDNIHIHWFFESISHLLSGEYRDEYEIISKVAIKNLRDELFLYKNPDHIYHINNMYLKLNMVYSFAIEESIRVMHDLIKKISDQQDILKEDCCKKLYHLHLIESFKNNHPIDNEITTMVKRIKFDNWDNDIKKRLVQSISKLK